MSQLSDAITALESSHTSFAGTVRSKLAELQSQVASLQTSAATPDDMARITAIKESLDSYVQSLNNTGTL